MMVCECVGGPCCFEQRVGDSGGGTGREGRGRKGRVEMGEYRGGRSMRWRGRSGRS